MPTADLTERKLAEDRAERQFKVLADLIPQLVWMAEPDGNIYWYNRRWYDYTGTTFEQMQGWGWQSVHDLRELPRVLERWQGCIASGEAFDMIFPLKGGDGMFRPFLTRVAPIKNAQGDVERWFGTNTDVTEIEQRVAERTAALAAANVTLAQKNEEVEAFVYIVSHDLRAPLVNIQGFAAEISRSCASLEETLRDAALPPDVGAAVRRIVADGIAGALTYISASTAKFQRLIDTLLVLSRTGRQELRIEDADVRGIVDSSILSLRQMIQAGGADVVVEALPSIRGDITALGQVFSNLICNALKYSQPGRPARIVVGGELLDGRIHYWVRDNGAGIPASAQRRLFQVFQRFHPDLASGDGMGLAIVKRLIERHGGRVWAESEEGVGTTFHMELPATGDMSGG